MWCSSLRHCIAVLEASLQIRLRSRAVLQPAASWKVFSPTHWCGWLLGYASSVSRSSLARQGCVSGGHIALDLRLSQVCKGVTAMEQDCNYQLYITKLGRKRGNKYKIIYITVALFEIMIDARSLTLYLQYRHFRCHIT